MSFERIEFVAAPAQDERQLDGARHLEFAAEEGAIALSLRIVLDREGAVEEGELTLTRGNVEESGSVEPGAFAGESEPLEIVLEADLGGRELLLFLEQREDGEFDIILDPGGGE